MRSLHLIPVLVGCALLLVPSLARADALDDGVRHIGLQLQCPVCHGENAADSPSGLATDMRSVIRTKLSAGESDQQILDEFVASYGDSILTEPPKRGISLGVWAGPIVGRCPGRDPGQRAAVVLAAPGHDRRDQVVPRGACNMPKTTMIGGQSSSARATGGLAPDQVVFVTKDGRAQRLSRGCCRSDDACSGISANIQSRQGRHQR